MKNDEETLLDLAFRDYNVAAMIYNNRGEDDVYLNHIGYHLQQAVEKTVKYLLELNGVEPPWKHDISQLIFVAEEQGVDLLMPEYISDHSDTLTLWESKTRYVLGYKVELSKIEKMMQAVKEYLEEVQRAELQEIEEAQESEAAESEKVQEVNPDVTEKEA